MAIKNEKNIKQGGRKVQKKLYCLNGPQKRIIYFTMTVRFWCSCHLKEKKRKQRINKASFCPNSFSLLSSFESLDILGRFHQHLRAFLANCVWLLVNEIGQWGNRYSACYCGFHMLIKLNSNFFAKQTFRFAKKVVEIDPFSSVMLCHLSGTLKTESAY
jgi:hypothetical protein